MNRTALMERVWGDDFRRLKRRRINKTRPHRFFATLIEATNISMAYLIAFSYVIFMLWLALVLGGALYRFIFSWWR